MFAQHWPDVVQPTMYLPLFYCSTISLSPTLVQCYLTNEMKTFFRCNYFCWPADKANKIKGTAFQFLYSTCWCWTNFDPMFCTKRQLQAVHPWVMRVQVYSNEGPRPFSRGDNYEMEKFSIRLLQNRWANFNQIWQKTSLGDEVSSLFK